ncbi:MAG: hypothetical protein H0Z28_07050 [Archaeoglobus sp.]|nr:hypothetical protein [Archaeoglobus sp.]
MAGKMVGMAGMVGMLGVLGKELGRIAGEKFIRKKVSGLKELSEVLDWFFNEIERVAAEKSVKFEFSSEIGDRLLTKSKCPIYRHYAFWCDEGCVEFIASLARELNPQLKVNRISKQPESEYCQFEFFFDV